MNVRLTRFERRWAHAVYDTIFPGPPHGSLPLGICDMDLDGFLDDILSSVPFEPSIGLRLAIWIVALAPLFVIGKLATIASLGVEDRERVMLAIGKSPVYAIRSTIMGLKAIGALLYCGDARLRPIILGSAGREAHVKLFALRTPRKAEVEREPVVTVASATTSSTPTTTTSNKNTKEPGHEQRQFA